jgi:hypothetical protein
LLLDWSQATRGGLVLLRYAIHSDWPIPQPAADALMAAMGSRSESAHAAGDDRRVLGGDCVYVAARRSNLREARRGCERPLERRGAKLLKP